jgi:hypothetical protein
MDITSGMDYLHSLGVLHGTHWHLPALQCQHLSSIHISWQHCLSRSSTRAETAGPHAQLCLTGCLHGAGDVKGANVLLKTTAPTSYDMRGFVCKASLLFSMLLISSFNMLAVGPLAILKNAV